jgi:hypothetical protein
MAAEQALTEAGRINLRMVVGALERGVRVTLFYDLAEI